MHDPENGWHAGAVVHVLGQAALGSDDADRCLPGADQPTAALVFRDTTVSAATRSALSPRLLEVGSPAAGRASPAPGARRSGIGAPRLGLHGQGPAAPGCAPAIVGQWTKSAQSR